MTPTALIQAWVGRPYRQANCWALVASVRNTLELPFPDLPKQVRKYSELVASELRSGAWHEVAVPENGTVVRLSDMHVGVWLHGGVLHTCRRWGGLWQNLRAVKQSGYTPTFWVYRP